MGELVCRIFSWPLVKVYELTGNYGVAILFFALIVNLLMAPFMAKSKKSMMRTSRIQPRIQELQRRHEGNPQKLNAEMQKLYQEEGINPMSGCLWTLIPFPILIALYSVIRSPITRMMFAGQEVVDTLREYMVAQGWYTELVGKTDGYIEIKLANLAHQHWDQVQADLAGKIDGLMITARDGKYHYPYAKPYIATGIPMFLDKPITVTQEDAAALVADLKANNVSVCGGSTLMHAPYLKVLKKEIESGEHGKCLGGYFRAPVSRVNDYGNFFFYSAHVISMMTEVFGYYPKTVYASRKNNCVDCVVAYEDVNVHLQYVDGSYVYYAMAAMEKGMVGNVVETGGYATEFGRFYGILTGTEAGEDYADLTASVFIMNAINRSMETGEVVAIEKLPEA